MRSCWAALECPTAPLLLHKPHSQAVRCSWSLFRESSSKTRGSGAAHLADTRQSSPLKAGTTESHKQPAEGMPRPTFTEMHTGLYLKTHTLE